jgi:hypothetical protein
MKLDSKSLQVSSNVNGQKNSLRSTENTMKMKSGKDQVSFDLAQDR